MQMMIGLLLLRHNKKSYHALSRSLICACSDTNLESKISGGLHTEKINDNFVAVTNLRVNTAILLMQPSNSLEGLEFHLG